MAFKSETLSYRFNAINATKSSFRASRSFFLLSVVVALVVEEGGEEAGLSLVPVTDFSALLLLLSLELGEVTELVGECRLDDDRRRDIVICATTLGLGGILGMVDPDVGELRLDDGLLAEDRVVEGLPSPNLGDDDVDPGRSPLSLDCA